MLGGVENGMMVQWQRERGRERESRETGRRKNACLRAPSSQHAADDDWGGSASSTTAEAACCVRLLNRRRGRVAQPPRNPRPLPPPSLSKARRVEKSLAGEPARPFRRSEIMLRGVAAAAAQRVSSAAPLCAPAVTLCDAVLVAAASVRL